MKIDARDIGYRRLGEMLRETAEREIEISGCCGQRYIASGMGGKELFITGTPGNALGAYLDGAVIHVKGNAQEATGDTMNEGEIYIDGRAGDATGYAMRGGAIYIHGDAGYRCGIHMKAYEEKSPLLMIGGEAGSFLGEYQAGGTIVVLGLRTAGRVPVGNYCGMGMYGGKIFLRSDTRPEKLGGRLLVHETTPQELAEIAGALERFCREFHEELEEVLAGRFYTVEPDSANPYKQLYTAN